MGDVAGGDDEKSLLPQRRERAAEAQSAGRAVARLDRQGDHRHVGVGKHETQWHPGAVIEATHGIERDRQSGMGQGCGHLPGGLRATRRGVPDCVQLGGEPAEVVDRLHLRGQPDGRDGGSPVRADSDDGPRGRQAPGQAPERGSCSTGLQGEGRRAVRNEQGRLAEYVHG